MKVAIVHDWLVNYGGAESVVEELLKIYPDATLYTLVYDKTRMPERFQKYKIKTTYFQKFPFATKLYKSMLTMMPKAFEALDLSEYDLIISSCSSCSKGVLTKPSSVHICYCHTPTRYVWDMYYDYRSHAGLIKRMLMPGMIHKMRMWDRMAADRVDYFVSNSDFIGKRIKKFYRRESTTIYPGVHLNDYPVEDTPEDYYLVASRFVYYKRIDLAIQACNKLGRRLVIVGGGDEEKNLRKIAGPTIEFKGRLSDDDLRKTYSHAKAFLFPGEEDFGITPVEAQSAGVPVLAYGKGGALETVQDGRTGLFFDEQSAEALASCITRFESQGLSLTREQIKAEVQKFADSRFRKVFLSFVENCMDKGV